MGTVNNVVVPVEEIFPFTGFGQFVQDRSNAPRSVVTYTVLNEVIVAATGGNDRLININIELPKNFSYALIESNAMVASAVGVANGCVSAFAQIQVFNPAGKVRRIPTVYNHVQSAVLQNGNSSSVFDFEKPSEVFLAPAGGSLFYSNQYFDPTVNGGELGFNLSVRFLQFDVSQTHNVAVNTPQLIR